MIHEPCDQKVFDKGTVIAVFELGSDAMEAVVKDKRKYHPDVKIDWHYMGGRAVVKALGETNDVAAAFQSFNRMCLGIDHDIPIVLADGTTASINHAR